MKEEHKALNYIFSLLAPDMSTIDEERDGKEENNIYIFLLI